jgi:hypothetical protein
MLKAINGQPFTAGMKYIINKFLRNILLCPGFSFTNRAVAKQKRGR